jgi:hypothetical protein
MEGVIFNPADPRALMHLFDVQQPAAPISGNAKKSLCGQASPLSGRTNKAAQPMDLSTDDTTVVMAAVSTPSVAGVTPVRSRKL